MWQEQYLTTGHNDLLPTNIAFEFLFGKAGFAMYFHENHFRTFQEDQGLYLISATYSEDLLTVSNINKYFSEQST